jgi:MFS family permease
MKTIKSDYQIPPEGIETPRGHLYALPGTGKQILFLVSSFFTAILLGFIVSSIPGDLSDFAKGVIYFVYILIFILGYGAWASWLGAIAFKSFKLPLMKILFKVFVQKEKPDSLEKLLPTREQTIEILVRSQKAAIIFFILSWPIGILGGVASLFMNTSISALYFFIIIVITAVMFGYIIFYFGRRGYLLFPEDG